jgi:hypothetical protein
LAKRAQSRWSTAAERAIPLRRAASRTIEIRFTRAVPGVAVSSNRDDLRTCSGAPAFRMGSGGRNGRKPSEDGADDHISR